jgi:hypothetical protein
MAAKPLWYISFADQERFQGATVVRADSPADALSEAAARGINPGGEAAIVPVPVPTPPDALSYENRLVGKEELMADGGARLGDLPKDKRRLFDHLATKVCEDCNPTS